MGDENMLQNGQSFTGVRDKEIPEEVPSLRDSSEI